MLFLIEYQHRRIPAEKEEIMNLKKLICILGIGMTLTMAAACTGNAGSQQTQENEALEDTQDTEVSEDAQQEDAAEESTQEDPGEAVSEAPVRIYGTITEVGEDTLTVDNQSDASTSGEIILNIDPENTILADAQSGLPLLLSDVQAGSFEAYLGPVMTMSIPPHTTPYVVVANIPEDGTAPQYAVAAGTPVLENGVYTLEATDGRTYTIPEDVEISPFRTRNIVTLADLTEGRASLLWLDENGTVSKVVLLETETQNAEATETQTDAE